MANNPLQYTHFNQQQRKAFLFGVSLLLSFTVSQLC